MVWCWKQDYGIQENRYVEQEKKKNLGQGFDMSRAATSDRCMRPRRQLFLREPKCSWTSDAGSVKALQPVEGSIWT